MTEMTIRTSIAGDTSLVETEIEHFRADIARYGSGLVPSAVFLEHRLRHGVYGQRQDGVHMMRSKIPLGIISPDVLDAFADVAERFGHGIAHLTTRQDIQVHFIALEQTPDFMRVLARAQATTREACGNVVRNVCASEVSGVLPGEAFDVTGHGMALARFLLRHPDGQSLGRKFKITLASSFDARWNLAVIHDIGVTAVLKDGARGFHFRVGGGLGAVPHEAQVIYDFLPEEELLPVSHAILRLFARHGEKKNRARARLKFLVAKWGLERFRQEVEAERATLTDCEEWTQFIAKLEEWTDSPLHGPGAAMPEPRDEDEVQWQRTAVLKQRQDGYATIKVFVPRGDLTPDQLRGLAALLREHTGDTMRIGVDQSLSIRFVSFDRLARVRDALGALDLGGSRAGGIADPVTCPGADTCKLGITSPRSVSRRNQAALDRLAANPRLEGLTIKISGCPNSCAQQQIADIGLFGAARTHEGVTAPHYMLLLGGHAGGVGSGETLGDGFGRIVTKVPSARVGEAIERLCTLFLEEASEGEAFGAFAKRLGRARFKALLADLAVLPSPTQDPGFFREFGKDEAFAVRRGVGECAGEVVQLSDLLLTRADREADEADQLLEDGATAEQIVPTAHSAMTQAARALLATEGLTNPSEFDTREEFRRRFYESGRIFEGVGHYYLATESETSEQVEGDRLRRLVVEAGLFVEEAHTILAKIILAPASQPARPAAK
jgi:sulfite reductase beta subunit-like hemoprotein/uncharacterized protein (UPF0332 family)